MVRLIRDLLRPYRWFLVIIVAAVLLLAAMGLAAPWPLKIIIDSVLTTPLTQSRDGRPGSRRRWHTAAKCRSRRWRQSSS